MTRKFALIAVAMTIALSLVGCAGGAEPAPDASETPSTEAPSSPEVSAAEQLVQTKCTMCHDLSRVEGANYDEAKWDETVTRMQQNGLVVTAEERQQIIDYLVEQDAAQ
jgi:cytochrome c5